MPAADLPDPGLFGPDSVTWRLHRHPTMLVGGIRALVVQALEPRAMAAVADAGGFERDVAGRMARTSEYVTTITFGDTASAERAAAMVRRIHADIGGVDERTGLPYRADDPDLLLWVHDVFVDSILEGYTRFGGWLSRADADRYVAEQVRAAELVGLDPAQVPTTWDGVRDHLAGVPGLEATPAARVGVRRLATMPMPLTARPVWAVAVGAALSTLPRWAKAAYGLPWCPPADAAIRPGVFGLLKVLGATVPPPPAIRRAEERLGRQAA